MGRDRKKIASLDFWSPPVQPYMHSHMQIDIFTARYTEHAHKCTILVPQSAELNYVYNLDKHIYNGKFRSIADW